jgi:predicted peptidase
MPERAAPRQRHEVLERPSARLSHLAYLRYLPPGYDADPARRWPLVLFLHGAGERGHDLDAVKRHGLARALEEDPTERFPFVAISPQCPPGTWWTGHLEALDALLEHATRRHRIDPDRVYVTGLSMGGYGTWALAIAFPTRFAAVVPVCGGGEPERAYRIAHLPAWVFHGALDDIVPLSESEAMVEALRRAGGAPRFTVYPDGGHDSWTATFANPELYRWLLAQRRA